MNTAKTYRQGLSVVDTGEHIYKKQVGTKRVYKNSQVKGEGERGSGIILKL